MKCLLLLAQLETDTVLQVASVIVAALVASNVAQWALQKRRTEAMELFQTTVLVEMLKDVTAALTKNEPVISQAVAKLEELQRVIERLNKNENTPD